MNFEEQLAELNKGSGLHQEMVFQQMRGQVVEHEEALLRYLATHEGSGNETYALALLADSGTPRALSTLTNYLKHPKRELQSWAQYGITRITGQPAKVSEEEALLVLRPIRKSVFFYSFFALTWGLAIGAMLASFTNAFIFKRPGPLPDWASLLGYTLGAFVGSWLSAGRHSEHLTFRVSADRVEGPMRTLIFPSRATIFKNQVDITKTQLFPWLHRIDKRWYLVGASGLQLSVIEALYPKQQMDAFKRWVGLPSSH